MPAARPALDQQRKRQILDAALFCFLQNGFAKTSMDDVAKKAQMSRPAIYLKFKNKTELCLAIYLDMIERGLEKADQLMKTSLPKGEKLMQFCEHIYLEPWGRIAGQPRTAEFYHVCEELSPKDSEKLSRHKHKLAATILGDREASEIFMMSVDGLLVDLPSASLLRKRIALLIDRFTA